MITLQFMLCLYIPALEALKATSIAFWLRSLMMKGESYRLNSSRSYSIAMENGCYIWASGCISKVTHHHSDNSRKYSLGAIYFVKWVCAGAN